MSKTMAPDAGGRAGPAGPEERGWELDDRSPYGAAVALVQTIIELSDSLKSEEAVMEAIAEKGGEGAADYYRVIEKAGHSVFYHQIEALYELGRERVRPEVRDKFCYEGGRKYLNMIYGDNLAMVMAMSLAKPHEFQHVFAELVKKQLGFYAGGKYRIELTPGRDGITLALSYSRPEAMGAYLDRYGLDLKQSFINSLDFIGGVMIEFGARCVKGYDREQYHVKRDGMQGWLQMPVGALARFDSQAIVPSLVGYIGMLQKHTAKLRRDEALETGMVAESQLMRETWSNIRRASRTEELVLLQGESGTGKSFLARRIHDHSARAGKPFVEVGMTSDIGDSNMSLSNLFGHQKGSFSGAIEQKNGFFSLADGGTIFLDEIGDATPELQMKLLRVLETSTFKRLGSVNDIKVDVRIIVATNRNLQEMVERGEFRNDLFYRLNVLPFELPPLRDRRDDIPSLAEFLLDRLQEKSSGDAPRKVLAPGLADRLRAYSWPGNIRELRNELAWGAAMAETDMITFDTLKPALRDAIENAPDPGPRSEPSGPRILEGGIVDVEALRRRIRATNPGDVGESQAHVDFAKRIWLKTLIEELNGDLALIAKFWDRNAERTLRNLIKQYGLWDDLERARKQ